MSTNVTGVLDPAPGSLRGRSVQAPATGRSIRVGANEYPVLLPNPRDARLHVAAVIVSIHVLGQLVLDFHVSVPQILAAILSCAIFEVVAQFATKRVIAWPASAMLTGSGVALILRDTGMEAGEHWSFQNWWLFALIATGSLATKYVIRWRGAHVFNPSNLGLVVAFLLLGSSRIEPLDFWWAPFEAPMIGAYAIILVGGFLITRRAGLLGMATAFWATLAACLGALAIAGHCMVTAWSLTPVCDGRFWWTVISSPETMIFLLFMITDPRTVPATPRGRIAFGISVGIVSALLIAPWQTEFGAKVGLLTGLVLVCGARPLFVLMSERLADRVARVRLAAWVRIPSIAGAAAAVLAIVALAGAPARVATSAIGDPSSVDPRDLVPVVNTAALPELTADNRALDLLGHDADLTVVVTELIRDLEVETIALTEREPALLTSVNHGVRLEELSQRIGGAGQDDAILTESYDFNSMHLVAIRGEGQGNVSIGVVATGSVTENLIEPDGKSTIQDARPFARTFALRPFGVDRWYLVAVTEE